MMTILHENSGVYQRITQKRTDFTAGMMFFRHDAGHVRNPPGGRNPSTGYCCDGGGHGLILQDLRQDLPRILNP
ncbi:MAG: hypothetical protein D6820_09080 [Lentisphaerae bacterium]|nr:MAG: hypothetical protein D6820_09080 [Lentisphaerota bacterium]